MRIVTVLKAGPEYRPEHAIWLAKQINQHNPDAEIVCLTDYQLQHPLIKTIKLRHPWVGWWSKLNLFSDVLDGDVFYMDIDTVVRGSLGCFFDQPKTTFLADFYRPHMLASGLMYIKESDKQSVFKTFTENPSEHMVRCRTRRLWGDQGFYSTVLTSYNFWQQVVPDKILSYKVHCKGQQPPASAPIICFHGNPRPWGSGASWVPKL